MSSTYKYKILLMFFAGFVITSVMIQIFYGKDLMKDNMMELAIILKYVGERNHVESFRWKFSGYALCLLLSVGTLGVWVMPVTMAVMGSWCGYILSVMVRQRGLEGILLGGIIVLPCLFFYFPAWARTFGILQKTIKSHSLCGIKDKNSILHLCMCFFTIAAGNVFQEYCLIYVIERMLEMFYK